MQNKIIKELLSPYLENVKGVLSILIYNKRNLSLIHKVEKENLSQSLTQISYDLTYDLINIIENEYSKDKDFLEIIEKDTKKFILCSLGYNFIIITIAERNTSDVELKTYSLFIASELEDALIGDSKTISQHKIPSVIEIYSKAKKVTTNRNSIKIIVVGDYKSGKSSIIKRFTGNLFQDDLASTVGFEVTKKILNIDDNVIINLAIWDTGGLISQISPTKEKIFKSADGALVVLDKLNQNNMKSFVRWHNEIIQSINHNIPIILVINKKDIDIKSPSRNIKDEEFSNENSKTKYYMVSAKTGENIEQVFYELILQIINLKLEENHHKLFQDIQSYNQYNLDRIEVSVLEDLKRFIIGNLKQKGKFAERIIEQLEKKGIPIVYEIDEETFGIEIKDGNVIGLGLFNSYLSTLPNSLASLKYLKKLILRCNQLIKIPEFITELKNLEELDLALTDLSILPNSIGKLRKLKKLYLENNFLSTLPSSIGNLENLEELYLDNNPINYLPNSLCDLVNLKKLCLKAPSFFYKGDLRDLPNCFGNLTSLEELDLSSCELEFLPTSFGDLKSLKILDLYNNNLYVLPDTIGKLKKVEFINLEGNNLKVLPNSIADLTSLKNINLSKNPLQKKASQKFKALALRSIGSEYERLMNLSILCEQEEKLQKTEEIVKSDKKISNSLKPLSYAAVVSLIGILTFSLLQFSSQTINPTIWLLFFLAIIINFLVGSCIIATISRYFKISKMFLTNRVYKIFDIFVIIYLIWSVRALVKLILSIELIPSINFLFEFSIPQWLLNIFVELGYNLNLTFLENVDLFLSHFYLKVFSIALVFWALYRNGLENIRKTALDEKSNRNIWLFLIIGVFGAVSLAIMNYSNLKPYLEIGYNIGVIIGSSLFIWELNKDKTNYFYYYILLISSGILIIWFISLWSLCFSLFIGTFFIFAYFIIKTWQNKKKKFFL